MIGTQTSSTARLWSHVVASPAVVKPQAKEKKLDNHESRASATHVRPHPGDVNMKRTYAQHTAQKQFNTSKVFTNYGNKQSEYVKKEGKPNRNYPEKDSSRNQIGFPQSTACPGFVKKERLPFQASTAHKSENGRGHFDVQGSASGPREGDHEKMNEPTDELEMIKMKLEKKDVFLAQEKYFKDAAQKDSLAYLEKIKEAETRLEAERQLTLAYENELNLCHGIIEDLNQSSKMTEEEDSDVTAKQAEAHKLVLEEIENLKKQLEQETSTNIDLMSQLGFQETMKESLEFKFAELTVQLQSALATSEASADAPESPDTEKVPEMKNGSSQTEDAAFENVTEQRQLSNLHDDVHDEFPQSEECSPNMNDVDAEQLVEQGQASEPEGVSEHETEKSSATEPERRHDKILELSADSSQSELIKEYTEKGVLSEPEDVSEPVQTTEPELVSKQDGVSEQKPKKRRCRKKKKKSEQTKETNQVNEQVCQLEDGVPTEKLLISEELATNVGVSEPEGISELEGTKETGLVSKPQEVSKLETEKASPMEPELQNEEMLELTDNRNTCDISHNLAAEVGDSEPELSNPVPTTEAESGSKQDGVSEEKPKKRRARRRKKSRLPDITNQCEVIEELPEPQDAVTNQESDSDANSETVYNPSLWRRLKKFLTPACLRQYKHKKKVQDPE